MATTHPTARLKTRYLEEIRPALIERFEYSSVMQAPEIQKITLNMGLGEAKQDSKMLEAAQQQLATIAGQQPSVRHARKSIANFKLREGMPVGVAVTLRRERAYEFLDRLMSVAIPRIRDFRGLNPRSFDGHGNYSMGVREQIIFPEIDYDAIDQVRGLDITITTNAASDVEAFALLEAFGMPFAREGRPAAFRSPEEEEAAEVIAEVIVEAAAEVADVEADVAEAVVEVAAEQAIEAELEAAVAEAAVDAAVESEDDAQLEVAVEQAEVAEERAAVAEEVLEAAVEVAEEFEERAEVLDSVRDEIEADAAAREAQDSEAPADTPAAEADATDEQEG